jgi:hypothetical protein
VLQVGEGDATHQRVPMQPGQRSSLKGAEPEFLFELLVRLLADPSCLDGKRPPVAAVIFVDAVFQAARR